VLDRRVRAFFPWGTLGQLTKRRVHLNSPVSARGTFLKSRKISTNQTECEKLLFRLLCLGLTGEATEGVVLEGGAIKLLPKGEDD